METSWWVYPPQERVHAAKPSYSDLNPKWDRPQLVPFWLPIRLLAETLLNFDTFHIPHVHLPRDHGSNPWERSGCVRSHTTDQTPDLMVRPCEACQCLLSGNELVSYHQCGYRRPGVSTHSHNWPMRQEVSIRIKSIPSQRVQRYVYV